MPDRTYKWPVKKNTNVGGNGRPKKKKREVKRTPVVISNDAFKMFSKKR